MVVDKQDLNGDLGLIAQADDAFTATLVVRLVGAIPRSGTEETTTIPELMNVITGMTVWLLPNTISPS